MKFLKPIFLLTLLLPSAALGTLWLSSWTNQPTCNFILASSSFHVAATRGTLSIAIFSTTPEVDDYRLFHLPLWLPTALALAALTLTACLLLPSRTRRQNRGFPL
ncbi:MAG: hypothetical protein ACTHN5_00100 [Phycisphaerae bacterium]